MYPKTDPAEYLAYPKCYLAMYAPLIIIIISRLSNTVSAYLECSYLYSSTLDVRLVLGSLVFCSALRATSPIPHYVRCTTPSVAVAVGGGSSGESRIGVVDAIFHVKALIHLSLTHWERNAKARGGVELWRQRGCLPPRYRRVSRRRVTTRKAGKGAILYGARYYAILNRFAVFPFFVLSLRCVQG